MQGTQKGRNKLGKEQMWGILTSGFKTQYKTKYSRLQYWPKDIYVDQWNTVESPEMRDMTGALRPMIFFSR